MAIHLFQYDLPEERVRGRNGRWRSQPVIANPSHRLWRAGAVRLTLFCWLVHEGDVPRSLIAIFDAHGVKWNSAPFDPSASGALTQMALESIRKEVTEYLTRARESAATERARLARAGEVVRPQSPEAILALKRQQTQAKAVYRRVKSCLERVRVAAVRFGLTDRKTGLLDSQVALDGIREGMRAQAKALAASLAVVIRERGKGDAVAKALKADEIFGPVAADYLDEIGTEEARAVASNLRTAYGYDF